MKLKFCGAARCVTGSCHMLCVEGGNVLIDCGMRQGADEKGELGADGLAFDPKDIDAVLLTHAHIDHSGLLPLLVKRGFSGKIITTKATAELSGIMLPDSAHIQEQDAEYQTRKNLRAGKPAVEPMYTSADARAALERFEPISYGDIVQVLPNLRARFNDAGHLLGSAVIELWAEENGNTTKIVFSGDIGRTERPILRDPTIIDGADYVIMEGTYGDREHSAVTEEEKETQLADVLREGIRRGGNIVIPSFAVGRTQELIYSIKRLIMKNAVDGLDKVTIFVDSPLGINATKVYERCAREYYDEEATEMLKLSGSPFDLDNLRVAETSDESRLINTQHGCNIIISASGMCDAGRIRHHLKHNLFRADSTIMFVGYQANGTLGRLLLNGMKQVKLFGEQIQVNAAIRQIDGFSGHAGRSELISWLMGMGVKPKCTFLVHGESKTLDSLCADIRALGINTEIPDLFDEYELDITRNTAVRMPSLTPTKEKEPDLFIGRRLNLIAKQWGINGALYCMRTDEPLYDTAIGVANAYKQDLNGIHTRFAAGNITMLFTAVAALMLSQQGKLDIDAPLDNYVDDYAHAHEMTVRELLLMQKAAPDYADNDMNFKLYMAAKEQGLDAAAAAKQRWSALNGEISDEYVLNVINSHDMINDPDGYAGLKSSYRLLGMAVERAYGKSLGDALKDLVFAPFGMKDSDFTRSDDVTYTLDIGEERIVLDAPYTSGGEAGAVTSAYDLAHFGAALMDAKLLDEEHTDILFAPSSCSMKTVNGWYYADSGLEGVQNCLYMNTQYGVSAALLTNGSCTLEDQDETGAYSFAQRMRYEMDDVYIRAEEVQLEAVNDTNVYAVMKLAVNEDQQQLVAGNDISLAQAAALDGMLPYAVTQNGVEVGFAMLNVDRERNLFEIWRLMIDARFQRKGFGRAAMRLAMAELEHMGAKRVQLVVDPDNSAAVTLYEGLGFTFTGKMEQGEAYMEYEFKEEE